MPDGAESSNSNKTTMYNAQNVIDGDITTFFHSVTDEPLTFSDIWLRVSFNEKVW